MTDKCPATMDVLAANVITAAEQQTMNYYMNTAALWPDEMGRRLYQEIGMVEEQHVTQYGSLLKPCMSRLENLLVHQYVECWLYWSCYETETDTRIRGIWQFMFEQELKHLHIALELLRQYEKKDWQEVIPDAEFPAPLVMESNIEYVRCVLGSTVNDTACRERYVDVRTNAPETFIRYQRLVNDPVRNVMSHTFIEDYIRKNGRIIALRWRRIRCRSFVTVQRIIYVWEDSLFAGIGIRSRFICHLWHVIPGPDVLSGHCCVKKYNSTVSKLWSSLYSLLVTLLGVNSNE